MNEYTASPPICPYCRLPLSAVNDTDSETGEFWSAHFSCVNETPDGRWIVAIHPPTGFERRYGSYGRACEKAEELADSNRGFSFWVVDADTGNEVPARRRRSTERGTK